MSGKGRVTQIEDTLKAVIGDLPTMASTAAVAKVEDEVAAMAAASSMLKSYAVDGVTDAAGAIAVVVDPPLLDCTVVPEGPQVSTRAMTWTPVRTADAAGRTSRVVFSFSEIGMDAAKISISLNVGTVPPAARPAGAGIRCRFRVTGRLPA